MPILGCSLELLDLLCEVIDIVLDCHDPHYHTQEHLRAIVSLDRRLQNLEQKQSPVTDEVDELIHCLNIAELYRLAVLIYLYRAAKGESRGSATASRIISIAYGILERIGYCERPWPLFIIALEARSEDQRATVLDVLEQTLKRQPLGAMEVANRMIRDAWVQQDLFEAEIDPLALYGQVICRNRVPPSFA
jgi:hypothetical protein